MCLLEVHHLFLVLCNATIPPILHVFSRLMHDVVFRLDSLSVHLVSIYRGTIHYA